MNPNPDKGGLHFAEHEEPALIIGAPRQEPKIKRYRQQGAVFVKTAIVSFLTWQNIFTAVIAFATVSQYFVSRHLWEVSKESADAAGEAAHQAKRASDIAEATLKDSEKSFEVSTRPYVVIYNAKLIRPIQAGQRLQMQAQLRDSGRTPAFRIHGNIDVALQDVREPLAFWPPEKRISAPADIPSDVERPIVFFGDKVLPAEVVQAITTDKTHVLYFYGDYTYSSLTKDYGPTRFCFRYDVADDNVALATCEIGSYDQKAKPKQGF